MKALSGIDLKQIVNWIKIQLDYSQLQDIRIYQDIILFEFYSQNEFNFGSNFLLIDLNNKEPQIFLNLPNKNLKEIKKLQQLKQSKPIGLFLNSHAKNLRLTDMNMPFENNRNFFIKLENNQKECELEISLIPGYSNLTVTSLGKKISWSKPKELPNTQGGTAVPANKSELLMTADKASSNINSILEKEINIEIWMQNRIQNYFIEKGIIDSSANQSTLKKETELNDVDLHKVYKTQFEKKIKKKENAIEQIKNQMANDDSEKWLKLGEHLKYYKQAPKELADYFDTSKSLLQNQEICFQKYKDMQRKKEGTIGRLKILQEEVLKLKEILENEQSWNQELTKQISQSKKNISNFAANQLMKKNNVHGRKLVLQDGTETVMGKSAQDNINLLRKARPYDLWFHLKDYPGSHAIVFKKNKNQNLTIQQIELITQWMVKEFLKNKQTLSVGVFDVLVTEVRFVRPIKGDKIGRVNYQNEKVYTVSL